MSGDIIAQLGEAASDAEKTWVITQLSLQTFTSDVQQAILAAALPHWFDADVLAALLQLSQPRAQTLYQELQTLSFAQSFGQSRHTFHDLTREAILRFAPYQPDQTTYTTRAHQYFSAIDDETYQIEALYHYLQTDETTALEQFKDQMKRYRSQNRFGLAHSLLQNAQELVALSRLSPATVLEIERQDYLMGWKRLQASQNESHPDIAREHLTQAIRTFDPNQDISQYRDWQTDKLRQTAQQHHRDTLYKKLELAQQQNDQEAQQTWLIELGDLYERDDDFDTALKHLNQALTLNPQNYRIWGHRGATHRQMGNYEAALADFDQAIQLKPDDTWTIGYRGATHRQMGNYEAALADLDQVIHLESDDEWAIAIRGLTHRQMGNYEAALADLDQVIHLESDNEWAIAQRGVIYLSMGNYEAALADFDKAILLKPDYEWVIAHRSYTHWKLGNYKAALSGLAWSSPLLLKNSLKSSPKMFKQEFAILLYKLRRYFD